MLWTSELSGLYSFLCMFYCLAAGGSDDVTECCNYCTYDEVVLSVCATYGVLSGILVASTENVVIWVAQGHTYRYHIDYLNFGRSRALWIC